MRSDELDGVLEAHASAGLRSAPPVGRVMEVVRRRRQRRRTVAMAASLAVVIGTTAAGVSFAAAGDESSVVGSEPSTTVAPVPVVERPAVEIADDLVALVVRTAPPELVVVSEDPITTTPWAAARSDVVWDLVDPAAFGLPPAGTPGSGGFRARAHIAASPGTQPADASASRGNYERIAPPCAGCTAMRRIHPTVTGFALQREDAYVVLDTERPEVAHLLPGWFERIAAGLEEVEAAARPLDGPLPLPEASVGVTALDGIDLDERDGQGIDVAPDALLYFDRSGGILTVDVGCRRFQAGYGVAADRLLVAEPFVPSEVPDCRSAAGEPDIAVAVEETLLDLLVAGPEWEREPGTLRLEAAGHPGLTGSVDLPELVTGEHPTIAGAPAPPPS